MLVRLQPGDHTADAACPEYTLHCTMMATASANDGSLIGRVGCAS